jgi:hypothetical protein
MPIIDHFKADFSVNGAPIQMKMVEEQHAPEASTIWLRLLDKAQTGAYTGFEEASPDHLPAEAVFLVGHISEFEKLFRPHRRRGKPISILRVSWLCGEPERLAAWRATPDTITSWLGNSVSLPRNRQPKPSVRSLMFRAALYKDMAHLAELIAKLAGRRH